MSVQLNGVTNQKQICEIWGVSDRELRDYTAFHDNEGMAPDRTHQAILDSAYSRYCYSLCKEPFRTSIKAVAESFGIDPRPIIEFWEVNPKYYPSNYNKIP